MRLVLRCRLCVAAGFAAALTACSGSPSTTPPAATAVSSQQLATLDLVYDKPAIVGASAQATATGLPEGMPSGATLPDGTRQISASGPQYRGPGAPATGPLHHYTFEVYALDVAKLDVTASTAAQPVSAALETRAAVMKAMQGHVLGKAVYVGLFKRPQ